MKDISTNNFDKLDSLLKSHDFEDLTGAQKQWVLSLIDKEEYNSMHGLYNSIGSESDRKAEIEPDSAIKDKLDRTFQKPVSPTGLSVVFRLKMPVYQSVAVALLFFMVGFFATVYTSKPVVIRDRVEVIKYVIRPSLESTLKSNIKLTRMALKTPEKKTEDKVIATAETVNDNRTQEVINPDMGRQQEIAVSNVNRVLNENNGSSIEGDTVLQKMLVTVY